MAPSKTPSRKGIPSPMSWCTRSPSTPRSCATSSMSRLMSTPTHWWPSSSSVSPLSPVPHPTSRIMHGRPSGKHSISTARSAICDCTSIMRVECRYLPASVAS